MVDFSKRVPRPQSAIPAHVGNREYCQQCGRRLFKGESEICRLCDEYNTGTLAAHEALYGHEEREMELERQEREQDGYWDGLGWHWLDDE